MLTNDKIINEKDAERLLRITGEAAQKSLQTKKQLRYIVDHYLFAITYNTGLRISEASLLNWRDIYPDFILIREGKGGKSRTIFFGLSTRNMIEELREARKLFRRPFARQDAVFIGERGRLSRSGIHRRFAYWIKEADLSPKLSFHSLRHGYATRLLDGGVSLASVREQLGHSNISVTSTYLHFTEKARERILEVT